MNLRQRLDMNEILLTGPSNHNSKTYSILKKCKHLFIVEEKKIVLLLTPPLANKLTQTKRLEESILYIQSTQGINASANFRFLQRLSV